MKPEKVKQYLEIANAAFNVIRERVNDCSGVAQDYLGPNEDNVQGRIAAVTTLQEAIERAEGIARLTACLEVAPARDRVQPWAEVRVRFLGDDPGTETFVCIPDHMANPRIVGLPTLLNERSPIVQATWNKRSGDHFSIDIRRTGKVYGKVSGVIENIE